MEKLFPLEHKLLTANNLFHIRVTGPEIEQGDLLGIYTQGTPGTQAIVIAIEHEESNKHAHILLATTLTKEPIRKLLLEAYPDLTGNKGHSIKKARSPDTLLAYVLKDDNFIYQGLTEAFIKKAYALSYQKEGFKKDYQALQNELALETISLFEYACSLIELKAKHNQPIYLNHIKAHLLSVNTKGSKRRSRYLAEQIFENLNLSID